MVTSAARPDTTPCSMRSRIRPTLTPILIRLIEQSAAPLATGDELRGGLTGFGTNVYRRWCDEKYGKEMSEATWLKAHAMIGTTTNVVTSVTVTDSSGADSPQLPELVERTADRFRMCEVSADKAYLGHANLAVIESSGAVPYIPFKTNSQGAGSAAWTRMWGACSCTASRSSWRTTTSGRTWNPPSRPSRGSSVVQCGRRSSPPK